MVQGNTAANALLASPFFHFAAEEHSALYTSVNCLHSAYSITLKEAHHLVLSSPTCAPLYRSTSSQGVNPSDLAPNALGQEFNPLSYQVPQSLLKILTLVLKFYGLWFTMWNPPPQPQLHLYKHLLSWAFPPLSKLTMALFSLADGLLPFEISESSFMLWRSLQYPMARFCGLREPYSQNTIT